MSDIFNLARALTALMYSKGSNRQEVHWMIDNLWDHWEFEELVMGRGTYEVQDMPL